MICAYKHSPCYLFLAKSISKFDGVSYFDVITNAWISRGKITRPRLDSGLT